MRSAPILMLATVLVFSMLGVLGAEQTCPADCEKTCCAEQACPADCEKACCTAPAALRHTLTDIHGEPVALADYLGDVVLMVNVASECGFTRQYAGLQALHEQYEEAGLRVLGFPCNQFGGQEPGSDEEIAQFCEAEFGVTFPMFSKVDVNGDDATPLYQYLTSDEVGLEDTGDIRWNFEKFLVNREGEVIARFRSNVEPDSEQMIEAIEAALEG